MNGNKKKRSSGSDDSSNDPDDQKKKKPCSAESHKQSSVLEAAAGLYEAARKIWLCPGENLDYEIVVKKKLRKCIHILENDHVNMDEDEDAQFSLHTQANDALTLLCIQKSAYKPKEVYRLLRNAGYIARLSQEVLRYQIPFSSTNNSMELGSQLSDTSCPCRVYDEALSKANLDILIQALCPEKASYWKDHDYSVHPPSPYFSYVFNLEDDTLQQLGALGQHVSTVLRLSSQLNIIDVEKPCYAEIWAHHRPHCSGHQLHYDSDNEGRGEVCHPLVSSILYLSDSGCGGPSLMTDQKLGDTDLAQNGWFAFPKRNRLCVFDGSVLHGVIPGRGYVRNRKRVSLMVALWKRIRIREGNEPGAARPLPTIAPLPKWYESLSMKGDQVDPILQGANSSTKELEHAPIEVQPAKIERVFSTISGETYDEEQMPDYERVFQGF